MVNQSRLYRPLHPTIGCSPTMNGNWIRRILAALAVLMLTGCHSITNLTPSSLPRAQHGLYRFEMAWDSSQQSARVETVTPFVMIGHQLFPMERTRVTQKRWECFVPVAHDRNTVHYQYKVNYGYYGFEDSKTNSLQSAPFSLRIVGP